VAIGTNVPRALVGNTGAAAAVPPSSLSLPQGRGLADAYKQLQRVRPGASPLAAAVAGSGADLLEVQAAFANVVAPPAGPAPSPNLEGTGNATGRRGTSALITQLDLVAKAVNAGLRTRVYALSMGGFDTHAAEHDTHARLLADLDAGLGSFFAALHEGAPRERTVVAVHSEFGRRVAANASGGTDHGTAAPVLVLGRPVRGGLHGEPSSLTDLDDGDLRFTTDFRSVYATLLGGVLGVDARTTFDRGFPTLPFL
jgi:uncharacterized protein (DUF1501 family)